MESKLRKEAETWRPFPDAMKSQAERDIFWKLIEETFEFEESVEKSGRFYTTEAFFFCILLAQEKQIKKLEAMIHELKLQSL